MVLFQVLEWIKHAFVLIDIFYVSSALRRIWMRA